jgi:hypothetical protein
MTKFLTAMGVSVGFATAISMLSLLPAQAKPPAGSICQEGYVYTINQPDWSLRGAPCWKPWSANPMLKYRAAHNGHSWPN